MKSGEKARLVGKSTSGHRYVVLGRGWGIYSMLRESLDHSRDAGDIGVTL